jgi:Cu-Zn family superoxide dismutase
MPLFAPTRATALSAIRPSAAAAVLGMGALSVALLLSWTAAAAPGDTASAALANAAGNDVGTVELTETHHGTLVVAKLKELPEGAHAFHVHTTGLCEPPFTSAGGHYNPASAKHGIGAEAGPHAGDMPNLYIPASGELTIEVFNANLAVDDRLLDDDGAAVVIHAGADDYETDPTGNAGDRIACGVIKGGPGG